MAYKSKPYFNNTGSLKRFTEKILLLAQKIGVLSFLVHLLISVCGKTAWGPRGWPNRREAPGCEPQNIAANLSVPSGDAAEQRRGPNEALTSWPTSQCSIGLVNSGPQPQRNCDADGKSRSSDRDDVKARVTTYNIAAHASARHDRRGFPVPLRLNALRSRRNSCRERFSRKAHWTGSTMRLAILSIYPTRDDQIERRRHFGIPQVGNVPVAGRSGRRDRWITIEPEKRHGGRENAFETPFGRLRESSLRNRRRRCAMRLSPRWVRLCRQRIFDTQRLDDLGDENYDLCFPISGIAIGPLARDNQVGSEASPPKAFDEGPAPASRAGSQCTRRISEATTSAAESATNCRAGFSSRLRTTVDLSVCKKIPD